MGVVETIICRANAMCPYDLCKQCNNRLALRCIIVFRVTLYQSLTSLQDVTTVSSKTRAWACMLTWRKCNMMKSSFKRFNVPFSEKMQYSLVKMKKSLWRQRRTTPMLYTKELLVRQAVARGVRFVLLPCTENCRCHRHVQVFPTCHPNTIVDARGLVVVHPVTAAETVLGKVNAVGPEHLQGFCNRHHCVKGKRCGLWLLESIPIQGSRTLLYYWLYYGEMKFGPVADDPNVETQHRVYGLAWRKSLYAFWGCST